MSGDDCITLSSIGNGAAFELFQERLTEVLENIQDPNTDPDASRKIVLEFTFKMRDGSREMGGVTIKAKTSLAGTKPVGAVVYVGRKDGRVVADEHDPRQFGMFDDESKKKPEGESVLISPRNPRAAVYCINTEIDGEAFSIAYEVGPHCEGYRILEVFYWLEGAKLRYKNYAFRRDSEWANPIRAAIERDLVERGARERNVS